MACARWLVVWLLLWSVPLWAVETQTRIATFPSTVVLDGSTAINCGTSTLLNIIRVAGTSGDANLSALNPQIVASPSAGHLCDVTGTSDTDTVTLAHGNGVQLWKATGSVTLGLSRNRVLPLVWTGTVWAQRGPIQDSAQDYTISPPVNTDVVLNPSGTGEAKVVAAKIVTEPIGLASGSTTWDGTFTACDVGDPCTFKGTTLERREYENGGAWVSGIFLTSGGAQQSTVLNIPSTLTDEIQGNSVPISTDAGSTASRTVHGVVNHCIGTSGSDAYACNMAPALDRYVDGGMYSFEADIANTTGATISFNGLAAIPILRYASGTLSALATGDIVAGQKVLVQYDGTNMQMQSTPGTSATGTGVSSKSFRAIELIPDGTNCVAQIDVLNSGPRRDTIKCSNAASPAANMQQTLQISEIGGCPAGALNMTVTLFHAVSETITWASDIVAQYRRAGQADTVDNTFSSPVAADVAITGGANRYHKATASVTPNGTCSADAELSFQVLKDGAGSGANAVNSLVVGVTIAKP